MISFNKLSQNIKKKVISSDVWEVFICCKQCCMMDFLAISNPLLLLLLLLLFYFIFYFILFFFCLGRLGRKSFSYTMCNSNGNPEVYFLFHPQLWQASWSSTNGLHWEVSSGLRPKSHHNPVMWFHASNYHLNENFGHALL